MDADPDRLDCNPERQQLEDVFAKQRQSFARNPYPNLSERVSNLNRLKTCLLDHRYRLADAVCEDFGCRARQETLMFELLTAVRGINYARRHLQSWMRPSRRHVGVLFATTSAKVIYQPKGVVGIIVPWNYPLYLAIGPATYALAAGNRVLIKMSEQSPRTGRLLADIMGEAFPEDLIAVVNGDETVAAALSAKPLDHLLFTGSTAVGRLVMRAAAENLTPVTLELGGKSPAIIGQEASLKMAVQRLGFAKAINGGQSCVAPDYVLVPQGHEETFVRAFRDAFAGMYPTLAGNPDYTSIVNQRHHDRLRGCLEDAKSRGATLVEVNPGHETFDPVQHKLPMVLVLGATHEMRVMQEEIFGPVLPVVPYDQLDEAIAFINARPRPLALYYFGSSRPARRRILHETHAGGVGINDCVCHAAVDDMPFGGIGASGMGAYHGPEGFRTFSHAKSVLCRPAFVNTARLLYPPYGGWLQRLVSRILLG